MDEQGAFCETLGKEESLPPMATQGEQMEVASICRGLRKLITGGDLSSLFPLSVIAQPEKSQITEDLLM